MAKPEKSATFDKNLCRLCGNTTNTNQRFAIFSDYGKTVKLQRLMSDLAKVRVQEDDCFPKHLCRNCYRTLLNLRDKLFAFQTRCATTQINLEKGGEKVKWTRSSPISSPFTSPCGAQRQKKSRILMQNSSRKALFHDEKEKSSFPSTASALLGPVNKEASCTFSVEQSHLSFQVAETLAKRSMVETAPQLSSNSSSNLETSAVGDKEKQIRKDERRKDLEVIYNSGLNNPELKKEASSKPVNTINVKLLDVAVSSRLPSVIASSVWLIPEVRNHLKRLYLEEILEECENAAKYKRGHLPSVLRDKSFEIMRDFSWETILTEAKERCPNLLDVITAVCCRREEQNVQRSGAKRIPPIGTIYSMLLSQYNRELNLVQLINTVLLASGQAETKLYDRFQKSGISLSHQSMLNILDLIGGHYSDGLVDLIKSKRKCHVVGDNLNIKTNVKDMRMDNRNKMHNWFMSMVVSERVDVSSLDNTRPIADIKNFSNENYLLSDAEQLPYNKSCQVLVFRVFQEFFDQDVFKFLGKVCPSKINHPNRFQMSQKTSLFPLPMHFKDEKKLAEMVDILCEVEETLNRVWQKSGAANIPDDFSCPFSGDQLTRVRATSARHLRAGCHTPTDRLQHTEPDVFELWHAKQNLLMFANDILMKTQSVREVGTLKYFRERIMRNNVYSDIKKDVDAFQDFLLSVGRAYLVEAFTEYFGMDSTNNPTKHIPPEDISRTSQEDYFHQTFGSFVDRYVLHDNLEEIQSNPEDKVMNYALSVIEFVVLVMQMIDTVHEGDGDRLVVIVKYLLLMFKAKSNYSKYAIETMRFITQVKCTLTAQMAAHVLNDRFVNPSGKPRHNMETDIAMKHTIKATKVLINGMGANKTQKAVQRATSSVGGVQCICQSYDKNSDVTPNSTAHSRKAAKVDELCMVQDLKNLQPFKAVPGRCHATFSNIKSSPILSIDWPAFYQWLDKHKTRMATWNAEEVDDSDED